MSVSGHRQQRVKDLFLEALDLPPERRPAFLNEACGADTALFEEVRSLLDAHQEADSILDRPALDVKLVPPDAFEGRRLGPYRVVRRIGRGGMGTVYLAARDDEQFRRRVAIKLVPPGLDDGHVLKRFDNERQTLAVLDHPNIVKLLDAGTSDDGVPYLVMDYVEGQEVDEYCESHGLAPRERVALFRKVCAAVHYAHQNLVVHRDLKPSNILVTPDGEPKLLDFGIAKLLRPEFLAGPMGLTRTRLQPMTPEYASPEQVLGRPITTASDIYSLGVVLYRLLTGLHPYQGHTGTALELERALRDLDPERPSTAARLDRDLDMIVMMALRKEPQRRYASVDHFSDDLARYLDSRPVAARKDTLGYRAAKFVRRHKAGVASAAAVAVVLVAATFISAWYAAVAHRERARAESRLQDVRRFTQLAFELDDAARTGSTSARQQAVARMLVVLNRLAAEAGADPGLQGDLMENYLRVGDLQGNPYQAHLGDVFGARQSYEKAREISSALMSSEPGNPVYRRGASRAALKLGELASVSGDPRGALLHFGAALRVLEQGPGPRAHLDLAAILEKLALTQYLANELDAAMATYRRYLETVRLAYAADPASPDARSALAWGEARLGEILAKQRPEEGIRMQREALRVLEDLLAREPGNVARRRAVAKTAASLGYTLNDAGRSVDAAHALRRSLEVLDSLSAADPDNLQHRRDYVLVSGLLAGIEVKRGGRAEGRRMAERSVAVSRALAERPEAPWYDHNSFAWLALVNPLAELRDPDAALVHAQKAVDKSGGSDMSSLNTLGMACEQKQDYARAADLYRKALALVPAADPHSREEIQANLRRVQARIETKAAR